MIRNYFKIAFRNILKNKLYSTINITGLAVGLASCILIVLFVRDELNYDKHFSNSENIYRVVGAYAQGGDAMNESAQTTFMLSPMIDPAFQEILHTVRVDFNGGVIMNGDRPVFETGMVFTDSTFFKVFNVPLLKGSITPFENNPRSIILTESAALKYFAADDPIGKILHYQDMPFSVDAVIEDIPQNSHFGGDVFFQMNGVKHLYPNWVRTNFSGTSLYTYLQLQPNVDIADFSLRISEYVDANQDFFDVPAIYTLQGIADIHLKSELSGEIETNGNLVYVYVFMAVAVIIVLLACINYVNLSMAGSFQRSKEIGIKKVMGASKRSQLFQFQCESVFVAIVGAILAVILVEFSIPYFNNISGKQIDFNMLNDLSLTLGLILVTGLIGLVAGSFPAFYLLKLKTNNVLRGVTINNNGKSFSIRNTMIVFQFFISIALIASTFIVMDQIRFLQNKDLGINTEQVVMIPFQTNAITENYEIIKSELLKEPNILGITASNNSFTNRVGGWRGYQLEGQEERVTIPTMVVAHDFFETLDANIIDGRSFSESIPTDETGAYVLNQAAVEFLGLEEAVGTNLTGAAFTGSQWSVKNAKIIGVAKNFHLASLHTEVQPMAFSLASEITTGLNFMAIRLSPNDINASLSIIEATWDQFAPQFPFRYEFMDDAIRSHYQSEQQFLSLFKAFAGLSLFIGCIGLFGLTAFIMKRRTKEIGIRKVLGAELPGLVSVLSKDFLKLVLVANLLGWPLAYYFMDKWLQNFAYQVSIGWWWFAITGIGALLIAFISIAYHTVKTARVNPTISIRYE